MSEFRQDRISRRWTVIAPQRSRRPPGMRPTAGKSRHTGFDATCPFCPGHEAQLPGIVAETKAGDPPGWTVRVVPNKFPATESEPTAAPVELHGHRSRPGFGAHEVVIESPQHDIDMTDIPDLLAVTSMHRERCRALLSRPGIETVVLFRNRGSEAGASQDHPHSQIIALGLIPRRTRELVSAGLHYFRQHGSCATCAELDLERRDGRRLVEESESFLAIVPFAAEHPFEVWIVPKKHSASFSEIDDGELDDYSNLLRRTLRRLKAATHDAAYRFVVETAPRSEISAPYLHWRLRIVPELLRWGGFELGAGMAINPSCPEDDAAVLRNMGRGSEVRR